MATKYVELLHVLIYANYIGRFYFICKFSPVSSILNKTITTSFFVSLLVKKFEHSSPLRNGVQCRTVFAVNMSKINDGAISAIFGSKYVCSVRIFMPSSARCEKYIQC